MSKQTKCFKTCQAVLTIDIDDVPATKEFQDLFFQLQELENKDDAKFDPRKYKDVLGEF